jgi:serine O-acetyltransferase
MLTKLHAVSHWLYRKKIPVIPYLIYVFNRIFFSVVLPPTVQLGKNVTLGYQGLGIVIHRRAVIGNNVVISPGVVIGGRSDFHDVPVIDDDVLIGAGAKILGPVRIGRGANVGANAVVLNDVAAGVTVVGIPAKPVNK